MVLVVVSKLRLIFDRYEGAEGERWFLSYLRCYYASHWQGKENRKDEIEVMRSHFRLVTGHDRE